MPDKHLPTISILTVIMSVIESHFNARNVVNFFTTKPSLNRYRVIHKEKKEFDCKECSKCFILSSILLLTVTENNFNARNVIKVLHGKIL